MGCHKGRHSRGAAPWWPGDAHSASFPGRAAPNCHMARTEPWTESPLKRWLCPPWGPGRALSSTCTGSDSDRGETQSFSSAVHFFCINCSACRETRAFPLERHVLPKKSKGSKKLLETNVGSHPSGCAADPGGSRVMCVSSRDTWRVCPSTTQAAPQVTSQGQQLTKGNY